MIGPVRHAIRGSALALACIAASVLSACGGPASGPSPTPNDPDAGECIDLAGPDDDLTMTVVPCDTGRYEVLEVLHLQLGQRACPAGTTDEIERSIQFGQPARTGTLNTQRYCLRERGSSAPTAATPTDATPTDATAADIRVEDVKYTSRAGLGDPMVITVVLTNTGTAPGGTIAFEVGALATLVNHVACTPDCRVRASGADYGISFNGVIEAGATARYEVELEATAAGSITWSLVIVEGTANQIFRGTGMTEIVG